MNLFYYFKELDTPMYQWQRIHFFNELERKDIHFIAFNPLDYRNMDEANEMLVKIIKRTPNIDAFMTCDDSLCLFPETMKRIKELGIPTMLICWDNLELPYKHKSIAPLFDVIWLTSHETQYLFKKWGCENIIFQSFGANPFAFKPDWGHRINTVGFIGSPYGSRVNKINDLLDACVSCSIYSNSLFDEGYNTSLGKKQTFNFEDVIIKVSRYLRFPIGRKVLYTTIKNKMIKKPKLKISSDYLFKNRSVSNEEMVWLYSNFSLSLNITELRDTYIASRPIQKVHLRAFEIPMSGGLQFASYNEELSSYFKEGKEIVFYESGEEMIDKARFYLDEKHAAAILKMKHAARIRAENEHTWTIRFDNMLNAIGLKQRGILKF